MNIFTAPNNKTIRNCFIYIFIKCASRNFIHNPRAERKELSSNENLFARNLIWQKESASYPRQLPSKTTMPILECILIDASTDVVKLTANDMELGIETTIDGEIAERGIIALNARDIFRDRQKAS